MIEAREDPRLALETTHAIGVAGKLRRQHLERHLAAEPGVLGAPDLAHPAGSERRDDPERSELLSSFRHGVTVEILSRLLTRTKAGGA